MRWWEPFISQAESGMHVTLGEGRLFAPAGHYSARESESCRRNLLLEMTRLYLILSGHLGFSADSRGFLSLCSVPAPLSLYGNSSFIQPPVAFLSGSLLLLTHTCFLIFTVGQQTHPSYQHISPEQKWGWVRDACTSKWGFHQRGQSPSH